MNEQKSDLDFLRWIQKMWATQDEEILCSECLDLISQYVDLELDTGDAQQRMPRLRQHLDQCAICQEEYEILLDLACMEVEGTPPSIDELKDSLN
jgi:hypothetical protein